MLQLLIGELIPYTVTSFSARHCHFCHRCIYKSSVRLHVASDQYYVHVDLAHCLIKSSLSVLCHGRSLYVYKLSHSRAEFLFLGYLLIIHTRHRVYRPGIDPAHHSSTALQRSLIMRACAYVRARTYNMVTSRARAVTNCVSNKYLVFMLAALLFSVHICVKIEQG